ncbi:MAG: hypothetical protein RLZZ501_269 [Pseudomonadota bacterium]
MLTDTAVRKAKPAEKPYRLRDDRGLYLEVRPTGAKFWRWRFELAGKESVYTIGEYPSVSLSDARAERDRARQVVRSGVNPTAARDADRATAEAAKAVTFRVIAEEWVAKSRDRWTPKHLAKVEHVMKTDLYPAVGDRPIREISAAQMLAILQAAEERGAPTVAVLIRQWASATFRYAISTLRADVDPTMALAGALRRKPVRHHPHLTTLQIPQLLASLDRYGGYITTKICMRTLLLTFVRTGELRQATWDEIDLEGDRLGLGGPAWLIPAGRMKMRRPHVVPLSRQVVALLRDLEAYTGGQPWLFPNLRKPAECLSITTINRALERMGYGGQFSGHGFRGTASTALNEMGYPSDHIEAQLAHVQGGVRKAYNHAQYLPERRKMMQDWADLIDRLVADQQG